MTHSSSKVRWRKYEEGREVWPSVGVQPYLGLDCLHGELPPLRVLVLIKTFHKTKKVLKKAISLKKKGGLNEALTLFGR